MTESTRDALLEKVGRIKQLLGELQFNLEQEKTPAMRFAAEIVGSTDRTLTRVADFLTHGGDAYELREVARRCASKHPKTNEQCQCVEGHGPIHEHGPRTWEER